MDIKKVRDIPLTDIKLDVGVYGDSGTGKTVLGSTFPDVCFVDCNGGLLSVRNSSASYISCPATGDHKAMQTIRDAVNLIDQDNSIKSIVIDSMSEVAKAAMDWVQFKNQNVGGNPNFEDWRVFFRVLEDFIVKVRSMNKHCLFIAHESIDRDEPTGKIFCRPAIQGQMKLKFASYFDEFYHAEVEQPPGQDYKYRLLARPSSIYVAKSRLLKDTSTAYIENPSFATLFKMIG